MSRRCRESKADYLSVRVDSHVSACVSAVNFIGVRGAKAIARCIAEATTLEEIDIDGTGVLSQPALLEENEQ